MNRIVLNDALWEKLGGVAELTELYNVDGKKVAFLCPIADKSLYANVHPPISEEELTRREQDEGGRTLQEILADLEAKHS